MRPIVPSPKPYGYRNRITVHAQDGVIGFFRRDSRLLIDIERCPISCDEVNQGLTELRGRNPRDGHYTLRTSRDRLVFSQTNDEVEDALRDLIADLIPPNQDLLIDGYCGAGFFAKALLNKFDRVIGIDWDKFAIAVAKENATEKETYIASDVETELRQLRAIHLNCLSTANDAPSRQLMSIASTTLIVDPPATRLSEPV